MTCLAHDLELATGRHVMRHYDVHLLAGERRDNGHRLTRHHTGRYLPGRGVPRGMRPSDPMGGPWQIRKRHPRTDPCGVRCGTICVRCVDSHERTCTTKGWPCTAIICGCGACDATRRKMVAREASDVCRLDEALSGVGSVACKATWWVPCGVEDWGAVRYGDWGAVRCGPCGVGNGVCGHHL